MGCKYGAGTGLLKKGGLELFLFNILSRFIIFTFRITLPFAKLRYVFGKKKFFSATIIL